jgi:flagellin-like protein
MVPSLVSLVNTEACFVSRPAMRRDDRAVSEVLGVVMLLAMVITIMGGVWIFLNPYLTDFEDNTNWNSAVGISERFQDRIDVAGAAPEGTGIRHTLALQATYIRPIDKVETWTISADVVPNEQITIEHLNLTAVSVKAVNESARSLTIETPYGIERSDFEGSHEEVIVRHNSSRDHWMMVTVYDEDATPLHKSLSYALSGIQITTSLGQGEHELALMNNARVEHFPNEPWAVTSYPSVSLDQLVDGEYRLSMLLSDVTINGSLGTGNSIGMNMISLGPMTLFTGEAYNLRFTVLNELNDLITPQYHDHWLDEYNLNRASGTLDTFVGYGPFERASGADGFTVDTHGVPLFLEVDVQRVEVTR